MTAKVRLTPRALEDLRDIGRYTLTAWGKPQRDAYLRALDRRFAWLAEQPARGRPRPDVAEGYRSFPHGSHVIFYPARDNGVDVIGVVHQARDIRTYFHPGENVLDEE